MDSCPRTTPRPGSASPSATSNGGPWPRWTRSAACWRSGACRSRARRASDRAFHRSSPYSGGMSSWWHRDEIAAGKLPLMLCFLAFVVTFLTTRTITRLIRDGRGPFRNNVTSSGLHIHHAVPGLILLMIGAFTAVGGPDQLGWRCFAGVTVGIGVSLVLDEFALILHLQDVYWSGQGQLSVQAVSLTAACLGLALVGFSPFGVPGVDRTELTVRLGATGLLVIDGILVLTCVLKGKY